MTGRTLQPCGTLAAHSRHRRRGEPIDEACRAADRSYSSQYRRVRRREASVVRLQRQARRLAAEARIAEEVTREREPRVVRVGDTVVMVGGLAGRDDLHVFVPDGWTGSQCLACFGWYTDTRHVPPPPPVRLSRTADLM
jgi:hypothetical protein